MAYGLTAQLPPQDHEVIRRLCLRWLRAAGPHNKWAKIAKRSTEMVESEHWSRDALAHMESIKRPALTINKIAPLYRLVMGYQSSNRMDVTFLPTSDMVSNEDVARVLTAIHKIESNRIDLQYSDSEVFSDGIIGGRGFWDVRLCFEENDFGALAITSNDPFSIYIDPDASNYDLDASTNEGGAAFIQESVWTDLDHIGSYYGYEAMNAVENISGPNHTSSLLFYLGEQEYSPERFFGQYADDRAYNNWDDVYHNDFVDHQAKRVRLLSSQYKLTTMAPCFVDLETGDKKAIPDEWLKPENHYKVRACLDHAEMLNNPIKVVRRPVTKVRWSVSCADVLIYDGWSPFPHYTKVAYFPYFRRGKTRGMIEDLIDPQMEINKKRSVLLDILNRNANSGWIWEEGTLDADQEENLRQYGSSPGVNVKWKRNNQSAERPQRLEPGNYPQGLDRLEEKSAADLYEISGINESALGQLDQVQSGRAIEARQRQAVLSIQMYQDNFTRSKKIQSRKCLNIYQDHYTEERVYRNIGENGQMAIYEINKKMIGGNNAVTRLRDITLGKYGVSVDEVPISATFKQGQFEETMLLLEKLGPIGMALAQTAPDLIIDQTSLPRKEDWKQALLGASSPQALAAANQTGAVPGAGPAQGALPPPSTPIGPAAQTPEMVNS